VDARAAWLRLTPEGLRALPGWVGALGAGGIEAAIPASRHGALGLCEGAACSLRLDLRSLEVALEDGASLSIALDLRARTSGLPVVYHERLPCAFLSEPACTVRIDTALSGAAGIGARANLGLRLDPRSGLISLAPAAPQITHGLDGDDLRIAGANTCGSVWCTAANLGIVRGVLADEANEALDAAIRQRLERLSCMPCEAGCAPGNRCAEGICVLSRGGCEPAPLATLIALQTREDRAPLELALALGDALETSRGGLDLGLRLGATPSSRDRCAVPLERPDAAPLPHAILERGADAGAHLRVVLSEATLHRALWAAHQSGLGCVSIPADELLGLTLPGLRALDPLGLGGSQIQIVPLALPELRFEEEGAIHARIERVRIEIEAAIDGRMLRLAWAEATLEVQARLEDEGGLLWLDVDLDSVQIEITRHDASPLLAGGEGGGGRQALARTYALLAGMARALVPTRIPLTTEPLPGGLRLARAPRLLRAPGGQRALELALRFGGAEQADPGASP